MRIGLRIGLTHPIFGNFVVVLEKRMSINHFSKHSFIHVSGVFDPLEWLFWIFDQTWRGPFIPNDFEWSHFKEMWVCFNHHLIWILILIKLTLFNFRVWVLKREPGAYFSEYLRTKTSRTKNFLSNCMIGNIHVYTNEVFQPKCEYKRNFLFIDAVQFYFPKICLKRSTKQP